MTNQEASKRWGDEVAARRKALGMTQLDLAAAANLTQAHISRIEDGKYDIRLSVQTQIAEALGCTVEMVKKKGAR